MCLLIVRKDTRSMSSDDYDDDYDCDDGFDYRDGDWGSDGTREPEVVRVGIVRVPNILLKEPHIWLDDCKGGFGGIKDTLCGRGPQAWMRAIAGTFPDTSLAKLRTRYPSILPSWLLQAAEIY
jgi:hypothetical protein